MSPDDERHGTYSGYQRHIKAGETPCRPCKTANRDYNRAYRTNPAVRERQRAGERARHRALWRLADAHRAEYDRLYSDELRAEGIRKPVVS